MSAIATGIAKSIQLITTMTADSESGTKHPNPHVSLSVVITHPQGLVVQHKGCSSHCGWTWLEREVRQLEMEKGWIVNVYLPASSSTFHFIKGKLRVFTVINYDLDGSIYKQCRVSHVTPTNPCSKIYFRKMQVCLWLEKIVGKYGSRSPSS